MSLLTTEQLLKILPTLQEELALEIIIPLNLAMEEFQINTKYRIAAFIAQIAHESGNFHYVEEIASGKAYEYREDLGNLQPQALEIAHANHSTSGQWFKGHGYIQITGYYNHKKCGEALGIDAVTNPKVLCTIENACRSAAWFWNIHNCNHLADVGLFGAITKKINGGFNGATERMTIYTKAKQVLKI